MLGPQAGRPAGGYVDTAFLLGEFIAGHEDLVFPPYRVVQSGDWRLDVRMAVAMPGYWGRRYRVNGFAALVNARAVGASAWMSMTPSELESLEVGIRAARGYTVVFGLGMGWHAANVALRPEVTRVTVVEQDPDIVAIVEALEVLDRLPPDARAKIEIVAGDAYDWVPDQPVDCLQPDIWLPLTSPTRFAEARRMQANVGAGEIYVWGQETEFYRLACKRADALVDRLTADDVAGFAAESGLPLLLPADLDGYAAQILAGASFWGNRQPAWWRA